jgi:hypothetical protein
MTTTGKLYSRRQDMSDYDRAMAVPEIREKFVELEAERVKLRELERRCKYYIQRGGELPPMIRAALESE